MFKPLLHKKIRLISGIDYYLNVDWIKDNVEIRVITHPCIRVLTDIFIEFNKENLNVRILYIHENPNIKNQINAIIVIEKILFGIPISIIPLLIWIIFILFLANLYIDSFIGPMHKLNKRPIKNNENEVTSDILAF